MLPAGFCVRQRFIKNSIKPKIVVTTRTNAANIPLLYSSTLTEIILMKNSKMEKTMSKTERTKIGKNIIMSQTI
ncbi:hypothetical protein GCM10009119_35850 [Algoriphagus jejuensis]|uniref:Uncharacterized protein n=1 Tax=Algoriphagus jejuensis TaxID=419934 RepID=A0ABP3YGP2_9BACT